jgi:acyl homoserine lactone synthase
MIYLVQKNRSEGWEEYLIAMHQMRADIFQGRLGWDVHVSDGLEVDQFDNENPLYLLSIDESGTLLGSLRLLPTTGPNMLEDVFNDLLGDHGSVRSSLIWEASRFCVATNIAQERTAKQLRRVTSELLAGLCEVGKLAGLQSIVAVHDARFKRVLRQAGWPEEVIGKPKMMGVVKAYAGLFPIADEIHDAIKQAGDIRGSVLSENAVVETIAA